MSNIRAFFGLLLLGCTGAAAAPGSLAAAPTRADDLPAGQSNQVLTVDGEVRHYFLYVPRAYDRARAWPLLVDFHGTASIPSTEVEGPKGRVEEFYALSGALRAAEREGFLLVRPRSRPQIADGQALYQWDLNPGDPTRNASMTRALVEHLAQTFNIDPARTYATGFSNGTNMALSFLVTDPSLFHGYAAIGGGLWTPATVTSLGGVGARVYLATGFRDYMYRYLIDAWSSLAALGIQPAQVDLAASDAGHDLYGWHYDELWAWLDRGSARGDGPLGTGWSVETNLPATDGLTRLARTVNGDVVATAADGLLFERDSVTSTWTQVGAFTDASGYGIPLTSVCVLPSGEGLAVGQAIVARTHDGGRTFAQESPVPAFDPINFGYSGITSVACGGNRFVVGGYWAVATTTDGGTSWMGGTARNQGFSAQIAAVVAGKTATWVAVGYGGYGATSSDGVAFTQRDLPGAVDWWNAVAEVGPGVYVAAGEGGALARSSDDGRTWAALASPTSEDLYGVAFDDGGHGLAVGRRGSAVYTSDGGQSFKAVDTGFAGYLGDAVWLPGGDALVGGQGGMVLRFRPNQAS
jgi:photosystem II stability/assembly factor-like uncharacterized protein/predicted esterase